MIYFDGNAMGTTFGNTDQISCETPGYMFAGFYDVYVVEDGVQSETDQYEAIGI